MRKLVVVAFLLGLVGAEASAWAGCCAISVERFIYEQKGGKLAVTPVFSKDDSERWSCIGDPYGPKKAFLLLWGTTAGGKKKKISQKRLKVSSPASFMFSLKGTCKKFVSVRAEVKFRLGCAEGVDDDLKDTEPFTLSCDEKK